MPCEVRQAPHDQHGLTCTLLARIPNIKNVDRDLALEELRIGAQFGLGVVFICDPAANQGSRILALEGVKSQVTKVSMTIKGVSARNTEFEGPARARRRVERENRRPLHDGQLSSPSCSGRRFASFQRQRAPAGPPNSLFRADTPLIWSEPCPRGRLRSRPPRGASRWRGSSCRGRPPASRWRRLPCAPPRSPPRCARGTCGRPRAAPARRGRRGCATP